MAIAAQASSKDTKDLKATFQVLDQNKDGKICFSELKSGLGYIMDNKALEQMLQGADMDKSGCINYTEFLAATMRENLYLKEENLQAAFKLFDKDGDGYIT